MLPGQRFSVKLTLDHLGELAVSGALIAEAELCFEIECDAPQGRADGAREFAASMRRG